MAPLKWDSQRSLFSLDKLLIDAGRGAAGKGFDYRVWDVPRLLTAAFATLTANLSFSHTADCARVKKSDTHLALIVVLASLGRMF